MAELQAFHDKILNLFNKHISHERDRASEAGADREEHGKLLELTGLNKTAAAWGKKLHKMEADKRDDVLRSFDALRGELEKNWGGQRTPDMFAQDEDDEDGVSPVMDDEEPLPAPSYAEDFDPADPEIAEEAADFEAALADAAE